MVFVESLQLEMPDDFPAESYSAFMAAARAVLLEGKDQAWREFAGASNLIAWRFRAAREYMDEYVASWERSGAHASFEEIYSRERALFGMFVCGVSCVESTTYALYALASHPSGLGLPFGEEQQRWANPGGLATALASVPSGRELRTAIDGVAGSGEYRLWLDLRNRMSHRSNLPRVIRASVGDAAPAAEAIQFASTTSTPAVEADVEEFKRLFRWLASALDQLLTAGRSLAESPGT